MYTLNLQQPYTHRHTHIHAHTQQRIITKPVKEIKWNNKKYLIQKKSGKAIKGNKERMEK